MGDQMTSAPSTRSLPALLEATGLVKNYPTADGDLNVLSGLDFSVSRGEMVAIVGESGTGKEHTFASAWRAGSADSRNRFVSGRGCFWKEQRSIG